MSIPLTELSAVLLEQTGDPGPGWRKLHQMACDARIPAVKTGRMWAVEQKDVGAVIEILGLSVAADRAPA